MHTFYKIHVNSYFKFQLFTYHLSLVAHNVTLTLRSQCITESCKDKAYYVITHGSQAGGQQVSQQHNFVILSQNDLGHVPINTTNIIVQRMNITVLIILYFKFSEKVWVQSYYGKITHVMNLKKEFTHYHNYLFLFNIFYPYLSL